MSHLENVVDNDKTTYHLNLRAGAKALALEAVARRRKAALANFIFD
jgi:hypothetical protein